MASEQVHRVTMFKVPDPANIQPILDKYANLKAEAKKDGKAYILRCVAGKTISDPRSQGYSILAQTTFASLDDMKYYDNECEAHASLKATVKGMIEPPPLAIYMDNAVGDST